MGQIRRTFFCTAALASAIKKAAHRKECSQNCIITELLAEALQKMDDPVISALLQEDEANREAAQEEAESRATFQALQRAEQSARDQALRQGKLDQKARQAANAEKVAKLKAKGL